MCFTTLRSIRAKESIKPVEKKEVRIIFRTPSILPKPTKKETILAGSRRAQF